jgi:hypothetical protein
MRQRKRRALFSWEKQKKLQDRIIARLLPPRPRRATLQQMLDIWRERDWSDPRRADPREEWDQRRCKLERELISCRYFERSSEQDLPVPEQVEEMIQDIKRRDPEGHRASIDEALSELLYSDLVLEPETRRYLAIRRAGRCDPPRTAARRSRRCLIAPRRCARSARQ